MLARLPNFPKTIETGGRRDVRNLRQRFCQLFLPYVRKPIIRMYSSDDAKGINQIKTKHSKRF